MGTLKSGKVGSKASTPKKSKKADLKNANSQEVAAQITEKKDLKYIYPEDATVGKTKEEIIAKRKKFRQKVRLTLKRLSKELKRAKKAGDEKEVRRAEKALNSFKKENLSNVAIS